MNPALITTEDFFVRRGVCFCRIAGFCVPEFDYVVFTADAGSDLKPIHISLWRSEEDTAKRMSDILREYHRMGYMRVRPEKYEYICTPDEDHSAFALYANAKLKKNGKALVYDRGSVYGTLPYTDITINKDDFEHYYRRFDEHPCSEIARYI